MQRDVAHKNGAGEQLNTWKKDAEVICSKCDCWERDQNTDNDLDDLRQQKTQS